MAHSKSKNWVHLIFGTKHREPLITPEAEPFIHENLRQQLRSMNCPLVAINGMYEHIHMLFLLHPQKALSEVVKQVKGGSSHAINQSGILPYKFAWATGYAAFSVSESGVHTVKRYIQNQKEHHKNRNFEAEYQAFLRLHGLDNREDENG